MTRIGMKLPMGCKNTQDTADAGTFCDFGLAAGRVFDSTNQVMDALPQGALTKRLIRYPSPYGRRCAGWHRPPVFFLKQACAGLGGGLPISGVQCVIALTRHVI